MNPQNIFLISLGFFSTYGGVRVLIQGHTEIGIEGREGRGIRVSGCVARLVGVCAIAFGVLLVAAVVFGYSAWPFHGTRY